MGRICLILGGILLCALLAQGMLFAEGGNPAPDFTLSDLSGNTVSLSDFKGDVIILDFWATWCPPCREEIPHFVSLYKKYRAKGLSVVGIALDRGGAKDVKPFVKQNGVNYPVLIGTQDVTSAYGGIRGIPTTFVIDRKGNIVKKAVGYRGEDFFENIIKKLL